MSLVRAVQEQVGQALEHLKEHQLLQMGSSSSRAKEDQEEIILLTIKMQVPSLNIPIEYYKIKHRVTAMK